MNLFKKQKRSKTPEVLEPDPVVGTAGSLREFVYLDEVSVYSLTSAPDLPPPVTMSESTSNTSGEAITANLEAGGAVLAKAAIGSELNSSRTGGKEVTRQFNIQSQFAGMHKMYGPTFLLTAGDSTRAPVAASRTGDLSVALERLKCERRAVREQDLTRGALAEMRVALRPHHMFDITAFTRTAGNLIQKYPELVGVQDMAGISTGIQAGEFFTELMEDLVPIEGRAICYRVVTDGDGDRWVVDVTSLEATFTGEPVAAEPLRVVGVAENGAFWKDTRRILHSDSDFDILGRIARTGLQTDWTPVKVIDTFKRVVPSAADGLLDAVDSLRNLAKHEKSNTDPSTLVLLAGTAFHQQLAAHHNVRAPGPSVLTMAALMELGGGLMESLSGLNRIADDFYTQHQELDRDADVVAGLRQEAWRGARELANQPDDFPHLTAVDEPHTKAHPAVELEFIAMYW